LTAPSGTILSLNGTWSNLAGSTISATNATLNLGNDNNTWTNAGTITTSSSTNDSMVDLGGRFHFSDLIGAGTFTHADRVNLVGTLDNRGATLTMDSTTGSW